MSSSSLQLVLDFLVFAIIHVAIILPLITRLLNLITQNSRPVPQPLKLARPLAHFNVPGEFPQTPTHPVVSPVDSVNDGYFCDRCDTLFSTDDLVQSTLSLSCGCTLCALCVQEAFAAAPERTHWPIQLCSAGNGQEISLQEILPKARHMLKPELVQQLDWLSVQMETIMGIQVDRYDHILDEASDSSDDGLDTLSELEERFN